MKWIIVVAFAGVVFAADEAADRAGIESTMRAFNTSPVRAGLFTDDFDREELKGFPAAAPVSGGDAPDSIPVKVQGVPGTVLISKEPMGEAVWLPEGMAQRLVIKKIRFLSAEVALVDTIGKTPVLVVMKKVGTWKIASLRVLAER